MKSMKIGFLTLYETISDESYVGSVLITDLMGIPIEFKCTNSVKPSTIQKSLYGEQLKPYIGVNLCGLPLIQSLENTPNLLLVDIPFLLSIRAETPIPTLFLRRAGEGINLQDSSSTKNKKEKIENSEGIFLPIIIQSHPDFEIDQKENIEIINSLFNSFDLIEPFERMKKSIVILGENDVNFK